MPCEYYNINHFKNIPPQKEFIELNFTSVVEASTFYDTVTINIKSKSATAPHKDFINTVVLQQQHDTSIAEKKCLSDKLGNSKMPLKKIIIKNKIDIGAPSNLVHVAHVGFNENSGFDFQGDCAILKQILQKAGIWNEYVCYLI